MPTDTTCYSEANNKKVGTQGVSLKGKVERHKNDSRLCYPATSETGPNTKV